MCFDEEALDWCKRARQAIATAQSLVGSDPDAAASRAYYAAFYGASALFAAEAKSFRKHSAVESAIHRELVNQGRWNTELGTYYSWLAGLRMTGDYGGPSHVSLKDAEVAVFRARAILERVERYLPPEFSPIQ